MDMMTSLMVLGILLVVTVLADERHCMRNGLRCPVYNIVQTHQDYEERRYPALTWVSTTAQGKTRDEVVSDMLERMYRYMEGENDRNEEIEVMVPSRTRKISMGETKSYTLSILLPPSLYDNPPKPTHPLVFLEYEPPTTYVVRKFGGLLREETMWDDQASLLASSAANDSSVSTYFYYWCEYDAPWQLFNRRNEIWMVKVPVNTLL